MATVMHEVCQGVMYISLNDLKHIYRSTGSGDGSRQLICEDCLHNEKEQHKAAELRKHQNSPLIKKAKKIWGKDITIDAQHDGFILSVPSFEHLYEPDKIPVDAIMDPNITGRLKGKLERYISEAMLDKWLKQDEKLILQTLELQKKANSFGATFKHIAYRGVTNNTNFAGSGDFKELPRKAGVYYQYEKATKYLSNWQTRFRAVDTKFGRRGIKADQLLVACAIAELFPLNENGELVIRSATACIWTVFKDRLPRTSYL